MYFLKDRNPSLHCMTLQCFDIFCHHGHICHFFFISTQCILIKVSNLSLMYTFIPHKAFFHLFAQHFNSEYLSMVPIKFPPAAKMSTWRKKISRAKGLSGRHFFLYIVCLRCWKDYRQSAISFLPGNQWWITRKS